ncbi:MAG: hypothetical protein PCFJNLEI_01683 [Verrucomicrobiae bacterium]|nr:hypothetical protein [Verrucomicrobiae bacterium]
MNSKPTSNPKVAAWPFRLKNILVPIDFSWCSEDALNYALPIARQFRAGIVLVHVIHADYYPTSGDYAALDYPALIEDLRRSGKKKLDDLARSIRSKRPLVTVIKDGHPGDVIVETAGTLGIDLIVISTHGRTGLKRVFLGSTAEYVVRHASCPVLTVRAWKANSAGRAFRPKKNRNV